MVPNAQTQPGVGDARRPTEENEAYQAFLKSKVVIAPQRGLENIHLKDLNKKLKPHAKDIALWAIRGGNRAIFASFGLAKTSIQLQLLATLVPQCEKPGLIVCPLGVKHEFVLEDEARGFNLGIVYIRNDAEFREQFAAGKRYFLTNYERVRDGALDVNQFDVVSLDESAVLRSYGSKTFQTFLGLFRDIRFKFVATATPDPNRHKELIHYAAFLGIMDSGLALTRFFKRDSTSAGNLTIHPHKEEEFWMWVASWAAFVEKPSDLGHSDRGYELPVPKVIQHRLPVDHTSAGFDSWNQGKMFRDATISVSDAAREKRDSLPDRIRCAAEIIDAAGKDRHWLIWHDLEDERRAIEEMFPEAVTVWGTQDLDAREQSIADFSQGRIPILATKPVLAGSGCNFQKHCYSAIFLGIGWKFHDFIQAIKRVHRFLQVHEVEIHLIYTESEDGVYQNLMEKWERHERQAKRMSHIIRRYGLNNLKLGAEMERSIGIERKEAAGELYRVANHDSILELMGIELLKPTTATYAHLEKFAETRPIEKPIEDNSLDLILTSVPFGNHYEYTTLFNDFGHNEDNQRFFNQMDFLIPNLLRALRPGRICAIHCKDRLRYGSVTGLGMYSVDPFSDECVAHFRKHGFIYCGRITIVTDVVRENNQTYRLGWTENSKDGTKMGVGSPEYVLLFRKLPTDQSRAYADLPVTHPKDDYTRARWQFDASPFWRSRGDRFFSPEEIREMPQEQLRQMWHTFNSTHVYDFPEHVKIAEALEAEGLLPASFMLLDPTSHSPWVWDDVVRMRTLNTEQARKQVEGHLCPLQFDVVERLIGRFTNPGELVFDPFGGLGTTGYIAIKMGRRAYLVELNEDYWRDSVGYLRAAESKATMPSLFDSESVK